MSNDPTPPLPAIVPDLTDVRRPGPVPVPDVRVVEQARARLAALAQPAGALGRLEDLAAWLAGCQGTVPPRPPQRIHAVVFAGDHGVAEHGVSAYPRAVTPAMVHTLVTGRAGAAVLARQHGVALRVLDISVDDDLTGLPDAVRQQVQAHKLTRSSGAIQLTDAMPVPLAEAALRLGDRIAAQEIAAGADLLIAGELGIGNTTPAAALVALLLGLPAAEVTGRGTGVDDAGLAHKQQVVQQALDRFSREHGDAVHGAGPVDPVLALAALGGPDLAVGVGFLLGAARRGVPVLLDGLISLAQALVVQALASTAVAWFAAGHRSTEPAQSLALDKLGLVPVLDLGMRLGEGTGALAAVPVLRSAALVLGEMALLSDLQL
ncbi:nicotinate-nucleotide--dimethylbenzimidazole phosphoribosyltransferase [Nakamurella leprariae]|uniref:nicotinate-nucleotide--dimethylbenzimidazole phosphoribosyltransferase n=1 Tax=Nakamurella leprariae TaxID=2803911 RepID=UPI002E2B4429|nr:nicotinate-nucleotide--dimethylbenzimidazole phosphoribosyltransferase [Nakamurella leprariae]